MPESTRLSVHINQRKWVDDPHWHFYTQFLGTDTHGTWLFMERHTTIQRGDEPPRAAKLDVLLLIPYDEPWMLEFTRDHPNQTAYVNIGTVPAWEPHSKGALVTQVDLDLDVVVHTDGSVIVIDEEEFADHQTALAYPDHIINLARSATDRAVELATSQVAPFDGTADGWWPNANGEPTNRPSVPRHRYVIDLKDWVRNSPSIETRPIEDDDAQALAHLMIEAYRGTIDYEGETLADAHSEVGGWFSGPAMREHSFAALDGSELAAAVLLVATDEGPLIGSVMTSPESKKGGLASAVVAATCHSLKNAGQDEVVLYITEGNIASQRLFARLGAVRADIDS